MQNFLLNPNIDKIAEEVLVCENFYTNANPCTPSRGTFLTGLYPSPHGAFYNDKRMDQTKKTFAHILQENGYKIGYIGKYHLDEQSEIG
jgi:arylsulfatase A-like enzyme